MRSLYWKIFVTFLVVVAASLMAGRLVFHMAMSGGFRPPPFDLDESIARLVAAGIEDRGRQGRSLARAGEEMRRLLPTRARSATLVLDSSGRQVAGEPASAEQLASVRAAISSPGRELFEDRPGGPRRPALAPCRAGSESGHVAFVMRPPTDDMWPAVLRSAGAAVGTVFFVAALLGLVVFRLLTRRLDELQLCLGAMASGDLGLRVPSPESDEIGALGSSFNRMAERLQTVVGELEDNDRRRRQLLADVSHELRTPLTVLRGQLETLHDELEKDAAGRRPFLVALEESDRLALLIDDLLQFSRMESAEFRLCKQEVVLQQVVQQTVERFSRTVVSRAIRLSCRLSDEPIRIEIDRRRIEQVVANLVQNALQSVHDGGAIDVAVEPHEEGARIEVSDDGRGIPPDEIERVFDRFRTGSGDGASTGLGLSIVRQIIEAHGGTVRLECRETGGIRAVVIL